ncbi:MAG TPA: DUF3099 domain-containing protein [Microbacterium sp.]|uniref:DUF3099 domain-containing protein n=1 Tax=Microbacterium sp. TaxID=51671 RepID=UPI002C51C880|nr:DUF3099 domain-containing protein [Microbacterium sp.]HWI31004.1 DUF3099 domain-containing protein [Microbacterium sp.]
MKSSSKPQSTTSVPRAPHDEAGARFTKYLVTMGIRIACFILMVAITPYGWYTWVFGAGAIVLPYVAVVLANVGQDTHIPRAESPERAIEAAPPTSAPATTDRPPVIRIAETPPTEHPQGAA